MGNLSPKPSRSFVDQGSVGQALRIDRQQHQVVAPPEVLVGDTRELFARGAVDEKAVQEAESGAGLDEMIAALPAVRAVGLVGGRSDLDDRLRAYADAGLDEVAGVPMNEGDPGGERTLRAMRSLV